MQTDFATPRVSGVLRVSCERPDVSNSQKNACKKYSLHLPLEAAFFGRRNHKNLTQTARHATSKQF